MQHVRRFADTARPHVLKLSGTSLEMLISPHELPGGVPASSSEASLRQGQPYVRVCHGCPARNRDEDHLGKTVTASTAIYQLCCSKNPSSFTQNAIMNQPPIVFEFAQTGKKADMLGRTSYTHDLFEPGTSPSRPLYHSTFGEDKDAWENPAMRLTSCPERNLQNQHEVCKAVFHDDGAKVDITHPWRSKGRSKPGAPWGSDTGTLSGVPLQWVYNWQEPSGQGHHSITIVRCQCKDDDRREVCRIVFPEADQGKKSLLSGLSGSTKGKFDHGRIEVAPGIITSQAGMDEMVSNACIQMHLMRSGWDPITREKQDKAAIKAMSLIGKVAGLGFVKFIHDRKFSKGNHRSSIPLTSYICVSRYNTFGKRRFSSPVTACLKQKLGVSARNQARVRAALAVDETPIVKTKSTSTSRETR
nr:hypothetical protein CFP56_02533 [Quercus suber]